MTQPDQKTLKQDIEAEVEKIIYEMHLKTADERECRLPGCTTLVGPGWSYCNAHRDQHGGRR